MKVNFDILLLIRQEPVRKSMAGALALLVMLLLALPFLPLTQEVRFIYALAAVCLASLPVATTYLTFAYREVARNSLAGSERIADNQASIGLTLMDKALVIAVAVSFLGSLILSLLQVTAASVGLLLSIALYLAFAISNISRLLILDAHAKEAAVADFNFARVANNLRQPRFAFHFSALDLNTPSHVLMWLPYLEALGIPFFIIVRERKHLFGLAALTSTPVILSSAPQLKLVLPSSVTTVFYANNAAGNFALINGRPDLQHIQLLHGDSDKPPSFSAVSKVFSKLFVAGRMAIDRYARNNVIIPAEKFAIVGRPQVARITPARTDKPSDMITVAYLPTWIGYHEDAKFSSLKHAAGIIDKVMSGDIPVRVMFKPHPMSYKDPASSRYLGDIRRVLSRQRSNGSLGELHQDATDPIDLYNMADILISDISSVIIDFLYSGKPYLVTNPSKYDDAELQAYPSVLGGYLLDEAGENTLELVKLAAGADPMREKRMATRSHAFGDLDHAPAELFTRVSIDIIEGRYSGDATTFEVQKLAS
ncbi:CDP-glycerol glycerophosphotransferase family protein [Pararhizobium sp. O133]|uniref:CDP-glycerol glycerophosphotransferase family protein n=1 Tax=Pararhizobium sp. O133 TaxID=3449278 RepID=UPI003F685281